MTTPASPVTTASDLAFPGSAFGIPQQAVIYTVQSVAPERIESVYMVATFPANLEIIDRFVVQLCDLTGVVLYEQVTPPLLGVDSAVLTAYLTWSRLGNDTAQLAAQEQLFALDNVRRVWCNMRLPDLVLQYGAFVNLVGWFDDGGESADVIIQDIAVTVTRNAGAVSDTSTYSPVPLLVPAG
jgi:hypothetical protein